MLKHRSIYRFVVHTCGKHFPMDMLRHDCAWPHTGQDAQLLQMVSDAEQRIADRRERGSGDVAITFISLKPPTIGRWASFGLVVREDEITRLPME